MQSTSRFMSPGGAALSSVPCGVMPVSRQQSKANERALIGATDKESLM
jgi:hypothetical protein